MMIEATVHSINVSDGGVPKAAREAAHVTKCAHPCEKIAGSFRDGEFVRVSDKVHPGWSRFYARVLREGMVSVGDPVVRG